MWTAVRRGARVEAVEEAGGMSEKTHLRCLDHGRSIHLRGRHPFKGVVLSLESVKPRTMCQYEVSLPEHCSVEQIAGLICVNIATELSWEHGDM
jgi:hypothetical protein